MLPKMKEIQKVVQKLSREQKSVAGVGGIGRRRTKRYKNIKSPPIYRGNLKINYGESMYGILASNISDHYPILMVTQFWNARA